MGWENMLFKANFTLECLEDIKNLYQKRNLLYRFVYLLIGIYLICAGLPLLKNYSSKTDLTMVALLVLGLGLCFFALGVEKVYWVFWKKKFKNLLDNNVQYLVDDQGIRIGENGDIAKWEYFISRKISLSSILFITIYPAEIYGPELFCYFPALILAFIYFVFAHTVTHEADFYKRRRWKASVWLACIFGILGMLTITLAFFLYVDWKEYLYIQNPTAGETIAYALWFQLITIPVILPLVFVFTQLINFALKQEPGSDDTLDRFWPDPNKVHENPIQPY